MASPTYTRLIETVSPSLGDELRSVRVVDIALGGGRTKRSVTRGTARAAQILAALGITDLNPPAPLFGDLTRTI